VGTGGFTQQIGFVGFLVRIGLTLRGAGAGGSGSGIGGTTARVTTGAGSALFVPVTFRGTRGDRPIAAVVAGGTVPAAAGPSSRIGSNPFTTTR
jgi:hypothetical protein